MLKEGDVVDAMKTHFEERGFVIEEIHYPPEQGIDLKVRKEKHLFLIEAKGQTSSDPRTKRYGKEFNRNQKFDHIAKASYVAMRLQNEYEGAEIGIALPDDPIHTEYVDYILPSLRLLNIHVFLVDKNKAAFEH